MTGRNLKLTTPNDVITARDDLEYWPQKHMAVARGDAVVVTNDAKRVAADTLVAYTTDNPPADAKANPCRGQAGGRRGEADRRSAGGIRQAAAGRGVRPRLGPHARPTPSPATAAFTSPIRVWREWPETFRLPAARIS